MNAMQRKNMRRDSDLYPLKKNSDKGIKIFVLISLLGTILLGNGAYLSYRSIAPALFDEIGLMQSYVTITMIGSLCGNIFSPLVGKLGDLYGRRNVLIVTGILPIVGALLLGGTKSLPLLTIGYAFCLMSNSFRTPLVNGLFADLFDKDERPKYIGYQQSMNLLCTMFAPLMGSAISTKFSVASYYLGSSILFAISLLIIVFMIPKVRQTGRSEKKVKIDWVGTILMQIPVIALCLVVGLGGQYFGWTSPIAIVMYVVTIVGFIIFMKYERSPKVEDPFLDLNIFKSRNYVLAILTSVAGGALAGITMRFLALYLLEGVNFSTNEVSYGYLVGFVGVITSAIVGGYLTKTGKYKLVTIIGGALNVIVCLVMYIFFVKLEICNLPIYMLVQGLDSMMAAFMVGPLSALIVNTIAPDKIGIALSMRVFVATISSSIIGAIYNAVYNAYDMDVIASFGGIVLIALGFGIFRFVIAFFFDDSKLVHSEKRAE